MTLSIWALAQELDFKEVWLSMPTLDRSKVLAQAQALVDSSWNFFMLSIA